MNRQSRTIVDYRKLLCGRLRSARLDAGLKQEQVARAMLVPVSAVSAMESGRRRVDAVELYQFSKLYGKPLEWFFNDLTEETPFPGAPTRFMLPEHHVDPMLEECMRLLKQAPKDLQRRAAYGVIGFLSER